MLHYPTRIIYALVVLNSEGSCYLSQVAIFVVLAMVLRRKPDVLVALLPTLRENSKYQGQEKLLVIIWMISQVVLCETT